MEYEQEKRINLDEDKPYKNWREGDVILTLGLNRVKEPLTPLMEE
jgi:hypothetical protein